MARLSSWAEAVLLGGAVLLALVGHGCGIALKDLTATVSANACVGGKVTLEDGETETTWTAGACVKGDVLGLPLPDLCADFGSAPPDAVTPGEL